MEADGGRAPVARGRGVLRRLAPAIVLLVGVTASLSVFVVRERNAQRQDEVRFASDTQAITAQLQTTLDGYATVAQGAVAETELDAYAESVLPDASFAGLLAVGHAVPDGLGSFSMLDMAPAPIAMDDALALGLSAALTSGSLTVSSTWAMASAGEEPGPVFAIIAPTADRAVLAVVDVDAFLDAGGGELASGYRIELFEGADSVAAVNTTGRETGAARAVELVAFDRTWTVRFTDRDPGPDSTGLSLVIMIAGFLVTGLVTVLVLVVSRSEARAQRMVVDATAELSRAEQHFRALVANASDLVTVIGADGRLRYVSPAVTRVLGYTEHELLGADAARFVHPDDLPEVRAMLDRLFAGAEADTVTFRIQHTRGGWRHLEATAANLREDPAVQGVVLNSRDVTERVAFEDHLQTQATHDSLTELPNRSLLRDRLEEALARAVRDNGPNPAILFVDLDRFKLVNDSLGHGAGDALLVAVAGRLRRAVRRRDTVARFGGDEFVVLAESIADAEECAQLAERIGATLSEPFVIDGKELFVSASVGMAIADANADTPETLLRDADTAMYRAKDEGRARSVFYQQEVRQRSVDRLDAANALHRALDRGELRMMYQPQVDIASRAIVGVEAFVAWHHPTRGLVPTRDFLELAEDTGLITPIGAWALREACLQGGRWLRERGVPLRVAVNIAARQLIDPELPYIVRGALAEAALPPGALCLEVTEGVLTASDRVATATITALHDRGVKVSIDDFGTGQASLAHLKRFPVDQLKIDGAFVAGLGRDADDTVIVAAVIGLAHALGVAAVAEGVEQEHQLDELRALHCDFAQGYLFARPAPASEIDALLVPTSA